MRKTLALASLLAPCLLVPSPASADPGDDAAAYLARIAELRDQTQQASRAE